MNEWNMELDNNWELRTTIERHSTAEKNVASTQNVDSDLLDKILDDGNRKIKSRGQNWDQLFTLLEH
jgi:hypothetical protein